MLYWLFVWLTPTVPALRVFQFFTTRATMASLTALLLSLIAGPWLIKQFRNHQIGQTVRELGPQSHRQKTGTPTMGGIMICGSLLISTWLWGDPTSLYEVLASATIVGFSLLGGADDYLKLMYRNSRGIAGYWKYTIQSVFAITLIVGMYLFQQETRLVVPLMKKGLIDLGPMYFVLAYFVIVGTSNAVNLTDGLDGLAILPVGLVATALGALAYLQGHAQYAEYLFLPYLPGAGELGIVCSAIVGACLGFLWFNIYPAQIFMGDVGSLTLGALLGTIAVSLRQELIFFIMGGLFAAETLSVMLQVASYKLRGKRVFAMAPLHHHFELKGWPENHVIVRFWIISFVLVLLGLACLKFR
jgi:phospho-N-acetylmuramoyl-pentapeptide-transferase